MIIPVRCFSCGRVLGNMERPYQRLLQVMKPGAALDVLGLRKDCCRTVMLTYVDVTEAVLDFEYANMLKAPDDTPKDYVTVLAAMPARAHRKRSHSGAFGDGASVSDDDDDGGDGDDDQGKETSESDCDTTGRHVDLHGRPHGHVGRSAPRCRRGCPCCPRLDAATLAEQRRRRRVILAR